MKIIKELYYTSTRLGVHLVNIPMALSVARLDGAIIFREEYDESVLSGRNVDKFEIEPISSDGAVQIVLQYRAQAETRKHQVGITNQLQKAEAWVKTANEIYESRRNNQKLDQAAN